MAEACDSTVDTQENVKLQNAQAEKESDVTSCGQADSPIKANKQKIDILLKATGNAPIMKTKKWAVEKDKKIGSIIDFVKKYLKLEKSESLFLYVNQAFAPAPDQLLRNLYDCYGSDGKLVLHYCTSQAWG